MIPYETPEKKRIEEQEEIQKLTSRLNTLADNILEEYQSKHQNANHAKKQEKSTVFNKIQGMLFSKRD